MPLHLVSLRAGTSAVVDLLDAELKTFDGGGPDLDVTPGAPGGWGWQGKPGESKFKPYRIVYPLPGGSFDGPLGCPSNDASLIFQVTAVGATREQCEWVVDETHALLVEQHAVFNEPSPLIPGRYVTRVWSDMAGGGVRRDDETQPPVFIATPRYRVDSTPLSGGS